MTLCQSCGSECVDVLDLGEQAICNRFLRTKAEFKSEKFYPLKLVFCPKCTLVQLSKVLPLKTVFGKDFNYLTGSYPEAVNHFRNLADTLIQEFHLKKGDMIVDIGSNDGTFLKTFKEKGMHVLGVEPAPKPAKIANDAEIWTLVKPFEKALDDIKILGKPKLVTALNVLAHTDRIHDFLEGIRTLGAPFVSQSGYLPQMIHKADYSRIYHEHQRFYTATSLRNLFSKHDLRIYDAEEIPYLGGSFIAYAEVGFNSGKRKSGRLNAMLNAEMPFREMKTYEEFAHAVYRNREALQNILIEVKAAGKSIAGVGAPMSMVPLSVFAKITPSYIDYTTEFNPLKVGTYSPGVHIPVRAESRIFEHKPDYLLIFAWTVADRIIRKFKEREFSGKFIVPFPEPRVVS